MRRWDAANTPLMATTPSSVLTNAVPPASDSDEKCGMPAPIAIWLLHRAVGGVQLVERAAAIAVAGHPDGTAAEDRRSVPRRPGRATARGSRAAARSRRWPPSAARARLVHRAPVDRAAPKASQIALAAR